MQKSGNKRCSIWWTQHLIVCIDLTERFIRTQITWLSNIFTSPVFRYQFTRITQLPWIIFSREKNSKQLHKHNGFFNSIKDWFSIQSMAPILVLTQNTNSNSMPTHELKMNVNVLRIQWNNLKLAQKPNQTKPTISWLYVNKLPKIELT